MSEQQIDAQRITKPIQLLAAWLIGLIAIDTAFLAAARFLTTPSWIPALLTIAAVANVPIFLVSLFLLQTKYRPEMQEDVFYAEYLGVRHSRGEASAVELSAIRAEVLKSNDATISLMQSLQQQNLQLASQLRRLPQATGATEDVSRLIEVGTANAEQITKVQKASEWARLQIDLNVMHDQVKTIEAALTEAGLSIGYRFGKIRLEKHVIAIGAMVPMKNLQQVIRLVGDHFEFVQLSVSHPDRVILGGYSYTADDFLGTRIESIRERLMRGEMSHTALIRLLAAGAA